MVYRSPVSDDDFDEDDMRHTDLMEINEIDKFLMKGTLHIHRLEQQTFSLLV